MSVTIERPMPTALRDILNEPGWEWYEKEGIWSLTSDHPILSNFNPYTQSIYVRWRSGQWFLNNEFLIDGWTSVEELLALATYLMAVKEACRSEKGLNDGDSNAG